MDLTKLHYSRPLHPRPLGVCNSGIRQIASLEIGRSGIRNFLMASLERISNGTFQQHMNS